MSVNPAIYFAIYFGFVVGGRGAAFEPEAPVEVRADAPADVRRVARFVLGLLVTAATFLVPADEVAA